MIQGLRIKLQPNNKQRTKLFQFAGAARFAYNWALTRQMDNFRNGNKLLSHNDLRKEFTILRNSDEYLWLASISNNATKQAIKDCCNAYSKFFKKQKKKGYVKYTPKKLARLARLGKKPTVYDMNGHPKYRSKKNGDYRFYQDTAKIQFTESKVKFESIATSRRKNRQKANWIRLAEKARVPANAKYKNPRISFDGENWYLGIGIATKRKFKSWQGLKFIRKVVLVKEGVGIDLGIKDLAICSDKFKVKNINKTIKVRKLKKKRRRLQRQVSKKYLINKKGDSYCKTSNIIKSEKKLLRINHRLTNIRNNHIHQATSRIIKRKPSFICLEDLNVQGMMKNKHLSEAIQEQKLYEFRRQIEYKAKRAGIPVIFADRYYPSSKTCICCGKIKHDLKLSDRTYLCECGNVIDRDYQAALNLKQYGESYLAKSVS